MKKLEIYNTLTRRKEEFKPIEEGKVKIYSCGPTTYDFLHVGNARAHTVADLMVRVLKTLGYDVTYVRNFTDVDDKIINRAKENNTDAIAHSAKFTDECLKDMDSIGLLKPNFTPKVSETVKEIIEMIEVLIKKGNAYIASNGEVLYHVPSFQDYGKLARIDKENMLYGKRVSVDEHKKHPSDFVLWKPAKLGEPFWESPFGNGRPGWHIECSAMAKKFLGETIDIHHGGIDLTFPHHENEIAQTEAANGKDFSHYWCHNEFVNFGEEKMSKSLGNVITIRGFVEKFSGVILRQIILNTHYRAKLDWGDKVVEQSLKDSERLHHFVLEVQNLKSEIGDETLKKGSEEYPEIKETKDRMIEDMANDFNIPTALSHFFTLIRKVRRDYLPLKEKLELQFFEEIEGLFQFIKDSTGAIWDDPKSILEELNQARKNLSGISEKESTLSDDEIQNLIQERIESKKSKNYQRADEIRNTLKEKGIELLDHPNGTTTWKYN